MTSNANEPIPATTSASTTKTMPGVAVAPDLQATIEARRIAIVARLVELKHDVHLEATDERHRLEAKLSDLARLIKENVIDGWANLGGDANIKLCHWLGQ